MMTETYCHDVGHGIECGCLSCEATRDQEHHLAAEDPPGIVFPSNYVLPDCLAAVYRFSGTGFVQRRGRDA